MSKQKYLFDVDLKKYINKVNSKFFKRYICPILINEFRNTVTLLNKIISEGITPDNAHLVLYYDVKLFDILTSFEGEDTAYFEIKYNTNELFRIDHELIKLYIDDENNFFKLNKYKIFK